MWLFQKIFSSSVAKMDIKQYNVLRIWSSHFKFGDSEIGDLKLARDVLNFADALGNKIVDVIRDQKLWPKPSPTVAHSLWVTHILK